MPTKNVGDDHQNFGNIDTLIIITCFIWKQGQTCLLKVNNKVNNKNKLTRATLTGVAMVTVKKSSRLELFYKVGVLKNFAKFTEKTLAELWQ